MIEELNGEIKTIPHSEEKKGGIKNELNFDLHCVLTVVESACVYRKYY